MSTTDPIPPDLTLPHISNRVMLPIWEHTVEVFGLTKAEAALREAGISPEYLKELGSWLSLSVAHRWVHAVARICHGLDSLPPMDHPFYAFYREAGRRGVTREALGPLWYAIRFIGDPKLFYAITSKQVQNFNRVTRTEISHHSPTEIVVTFTMLEGFKDNPAFCHNRMGYLESIPTVWGLPRALVIHDHCMHDPIAPSSGCTYRLVFKELVRLKRSAFLGLLGGAAVGTAAGALGVMGLHLMTGTLIGAASGLSLAGWWQIFRHQRFLRHGKRHYDEMLQLYDERYADLQEFKTRFTQLTSAVEDVFWLSTPDRRGLHFCSQTFEHIFGISVDRVMRHPEMWRTQMDEEGVTFFDSVIRAPVETTYTISRGDETRYIRERVFPLFDSKGDVYQLAGVSRDVTELEETRAALHKKEEQYRQAQKLESLGRLSGGIAHDFNNMLTVILGYSEVLKEQLADDEASMDCITEIITAGDRASELTSQLLAFSRKQIIEPKVVDPYHILLSSEKMLRRIIGEDVALRFNITKGLGYILIDEGQLNQVLVNLAVNARDALGDDGTITFALERARNLTPPTEGADPQDYMVISVTDTGCGIAAEHLEHIFEPFFTTKSEGKGTGLGLATVHGVVYQNGGFIHLDTAPGEGTAFHLYLPLVQASEPTSEPRTSPPLTGGNDRILLVEDQGSLARLIMRVLTQRGYTVVAASNGAEALETLGSDSFDLIITDVVMPTMSGSELATRARALIPSVRILFMSGYTDSSELRKQVAHHEEHFLQKPFDPDTLCKKIREVLDR